MTGGGSGIGLGIALALIDIGYSVFISGRTESKLNAAIDAASGDDPRITQRITALTVDVTDLESLEAAVEKIRSGAGRLDILVVAAGINVTHRSLEETTAEEWGRIVDTNATGAFHSIKTALPLLRKSPSAQIININSISGLRSLSGGGAAYCASKFAQRSLGIFAGNELASEGIRVTNIYPGDVDTPMIDWRPAPPSSEIRSTMVKPSDVGELVKLIAMLPPTAHISEVTIKPTWQQLI